MIRDPTIEALPDDVFLDIFEFYISDSEHPHKAWHPLVHVCRRWRYLVFSSPRRLDLYLNCTDNTRVSEMLEIWPPLPIKISSESRILGDNTIAALGHPDRIREIELWSVYSPLDHLVTMMQKPFPVLESLYLVFHNEAVPTLPNTFLGGSAPRLRSLHLGRIPFPTLPRLLLSCNDLVDLTLSRIPHSGYISPEKMATSISTMTRLEYLFIAFDVFDSPTFLPDRRTQRPPLLTHTSAVLPALTQFSFFGVSEYLEDLVAPINAPLLHSFRITLFNQPVFGTQQLTRFICHAPMFMSYNQGRIDFMSAAVSIEWSPIQQNTGYLRLDVPYIEGDLQVSSAAQICSRFSFLMSRIERLYIYGSLWLRAGSPVDMDDTHWLELFRPFTSVQALYLLRQFWTVVIPALHGLSEESVLPALVVLYLGGYQGSGSELQDIEPFLTARQHSGHQVSVCRWE